MSGETEACPMCEPVGRRECALCRDLRVEGSRYRQERDEAQRELADQRALAEGALDEQASAERKWFAARAAAEAAQRELAGLARESVARDLALARLGAEVMAIRAERRALYEVVRAARARTQCYAHAAACCVGWCIDCQRELASVQAAQRALDALPCWCGRPDGHASGCPRGEA